MSRKMPPSACSTCSRAPWTNWFWAIRGRSRPISAPHRRGGQGPHRRLSRPPPGAARPRAAGAGDRHLPRPHASLRVNGIADLPGEVFGPVLHVATFAAANSTPSSRPSMPPAMASPSASTPAFPRASAPRGHGQGRQYLRQSQPDRCRGRLPALRRRRPLGHRPKAGGPAYLPRFTRAAPALDLGTKTLPGPTGESNELHHVARGALLCSGPRCRPHGPARPRRGRRLHAHSLRCRPGLRHPRRRHRRRRLVRRPGKSQALRQALARRDGAILPLLAGPEDATRLVLERHVCIDTTAAGGNAALLAGRTSPGRQSPRRAWPAPESTSRIVCTRSGRIVALDVEHVDRAHQLATQDHGMFTTLWQPSELISSWSANTLAMSAMVLATKYWRCLCTTSNHAS